jgi:hypothetical protein
MKCVCGYEHVDSIDEKKGDESFIEITLSNDVEFRVYKGMGEHEKVFLKACPKCHTVKMTDWLGR